MDKVEIIKERITMYDVLRQYGFSTEKRMPCPLHNGEDKNFEYKDKKWRCYSHCGSGDVISFVQKYFGLSFGDTLKKIDADFGLGLYAKMTSRKQIELGRQAFLICREREKKAEIQKQKDDHYWAVFDEWKRLDDNLIKYEPQTMDEEWHPLYIEALQKIAHQKYLLDCAELEMRNL